MVVMVTVSHVGHVLGGPYNLPKMNGPGGEPGTGTRGGGLGLGRVWPLCNPGIFTAEPSLVRLYAGICSWFPVRVKPSDFGLS